MIRECKVRSRARKWDKVEWESKRGRREEIGVRRRGGKGMRK